MREVLTIGREFPLDGVVMGFVIMIIGVVVLINRRRIASKVVSEGGRNLPGERAITIMVMVASILFMLCGAIAILMTIAKLAASA